MEETRSARDFFDDEEYAFLQKTARAPEGSWAYGSDMQGITSQMASHVLVGEMTEFELVLERDEATTSQCCAVEEFRRLVLLGLAYGVEVEDAPCANYLGALYYMGELVPQDYRRAKELYALADSKGLVQGMINLGYIYEYRRVGEPDYPKAYAQYAKAVAIANHPEALYKLGDMYARGQAVEKDPHTALVLWDRSLKEAKGEAMQAQPAFRIAQLIADPRQRSTRPAVRPDGRAATVPARGARPDDCHFQGRYLLPLATGKGHRGTGAHASGIAEPGGISVLGIGQPRCARRKASTMLSASGVQNSGPPWSAPRSRYRCDSWPVASRCW